MIVLAFSDSHGTTYSIDAAIAQEPVVNAIIFCGDIAKDADYIRSTYPNIPLYSVCGNNDFFCSDPFITMPEFDDVKLYITHGHKERVKAGYYELISRCHKYNCALCVFGHTHQTLDEEIDEIHLINPGSIRSSNGTYAKITISGGDFTTEIKSVE